MPPHDAAAWAAAMTRVLDDSALASTLVAAGTAVAAAATWDRGGKALSDLFLSVTNASWRRASSGSPARN